MKLPKIVGNWFTRTAIIAAILAGAVACEPKSELVAPAQINNPDQSARVEVANPYPMAINDQPYYAKGNGTLTDYGFVSNAAYGKTYIDCKNAGFKTIRIEVNPGGWRSGTTLNDAYTAAQVVTQARDLLITAHGAGLKAVITWHNEYWMRNPTGTGPQDAWTKFWNPLLDQCVAKNLNLEGLNVMNEWGDQYTGAAAGRWYSQYVWFAAQLKAHEAYKRGLVDNIIIDAPYYGQDTRSVIKWGKLLTDLFPAGKARIGLHTYIFPNSYNMILGTASTPTTKIATITLAQIKDVVAKLGATRLVIGEIGTTAIGASCPADAYSSGKWNGMNLTADMQAIGTYCQSVGVPVMGWCWSGDGSIQKKFDAYGGGNANMNAANYYDNNPGEVTAKYNATATYSAQMKAVTW